MSESERIEVTRTVEASPEALFAVLATPSRHTEIDGTTMIRGTAGDPGRLGGVGDQFIMNMNNQMLGDYQIRNTVISFEENRAIGWAPVLHPEGGYTDKIGDIKPGGHTFTWELSPAGAGQTTVTQTYDWSKVTDPAFRKLFPLVSEEQLGESINRAAAAAQ